MLHPVYRRAASFHASAMLQHKPKPAKTAGTERIRHASILEKPCFSLELAAMLQTGSPLYRGPGEEAARKQALNPTKKRNPKP